MTQEEKELLIQCVCSRLPYDFKVKRPDDGNPDYVSAIDVDAGTLTCLYNGYTDDIEKFVPYLRSMSSMTEEEEFKLNETTCYTQFTLESYDWLNKKMFDYRGLIEKGLALEAPEGMY